MKKKYWYKFYHVICPPCGSEDVVRERVYDKPKPEDYYERHTFVQEYDWCQG